jgi:cell division protein FtsB
MAGSPPQIPSLPRLVHWLVPAMLLSAVGAWLVWGDSGLVARSALRNQLVKANADLAAVERENQRLVRELVILDRDPRAVERDVADQIGWARPGSTIYRFDSTHTP